MCLILFASDSNQAPQQWLTRGEWVMSVLTLVYVLLTGFYALTSHRTLKALEGQGAHAKAEAKARDEQFAQQLQVSQNAANAALLNATAIINSERPWIVVTLIRHENAKYYFKGGEQEVFGIRYTPVFKNYGRTLAQIISIRICSRVINSIESLPAVPEYVDGLPAAFQNALLIIPRGRWKDEYTDVSVIVLPEQFENIKSGRQLFICFGRIEYRDVLKPDVLHETRFSFVYRYRINDFVIEGPSGYTKYT